MNTLSGVGVIDKAMTVIGALEPGPRTLAQLVEATGLSRATAHRLAVALEAHGLVRRDVEGRFSLGLRLIGLGHAAAEAVPGWLDARPALAWLQEQTGESVQLYVRDGDERVCVESLEAPHELRTIVPIGARMPLDRGSAGRVLVAPPAPAGANGPRWVESIAEREPGVASVSAPVADPSGRVVAAVSVSGPIDRITRSPGRRHGVAVVEAAARISAHLA
ncbi:MAG TPA: IclR family transcriptional regulator [Acidimicrobiales bacterium]|nr:IclR family transcriptional regulator [Acidimicrobiales bacterium]